MPHHFADIAFTPTVKNVQGELGSRSSYARMESVPDAINDRLTGSEAAFIAARNSLYMDSSDFFGSRAKLNKT